MQNAYFEKMAINFIGNPYSSNAEKQTFYVLNERISKKTATKTVAAIFTLQTK